MRWNVPTVPLLYARVTECSLLKITDSPFTLPVTISRWLRPTWSTHFPSDRVCIIWPWGQRFLLLVRMFTVIQFIKLPCNRMQEVSYISQHTRNTWKIVPFDGISLKHDDWQERRAYILLHSSKGWKSLPRGPKAIQLWLPKKRYLKDILKVALLHAVWTLKTIQLVVSQITSPSCSNFVYILWLNTS